jgi:hypothetical protein
MIKIVELMLDNEFADLDSLKNSYLYGLQEYLKEQGYNITPIDGSEWYSYERKIMLDTNAPAVIINSALDKENKKQKDAKGILVS